jgi:hypothetical protein
LPASDIYEVVHIQNCGEDGKARNAERVARVAPEGDAGNPFSLMTLGLERQLFQEVRDRSGKNRLIPDL